ncbi:extracellular solute-binding protein [Virgibacillus halophilus]|uniref:Extracellular solute-binding protein n=1 Tax=Tigheibacillus halophilus TaxID=361280 RepID=A0ABU5C3K0_9BACI|nr:extracellular solute-binding protein [Virgibacillus halophilus]
MKKLLISVSLLLLMITAACSSGDKEHADGKTTIKYAYWDKKQEKLMKDLVKEFNKENPDIRVKLELTPYDQYFTKLDAAATGGSLPDVFLDEWS